MDLPTCPSCKQSVLDDDATICPFCGASMKGAGGRAADSRVAPSKPVANPGPSVPGDRTKTDPDARSKLPRPAKRDVPPTKPDPSSRQPASPSLETNDDPFAIETAAVRDAIPASRQRTQAKPYKVVCPMCETVGYVPTTAAGHEVRCANASCLVPIFQAPAIPKKVVEAPPPVKRSSNLGIIVGGVVVVLVLLGVAGAFYYSSHQPMRTTAPPPPPLRNVDVRTGGAPANPDEKKPQAPVKPTSSNATESLTLENQRGAVLKTMSAAAEERNRNRSAPYCERLTAVTASEMGDLTTAQAMLSRLPSGTAELGFYRVPVLSAIAWQHLQKGDKEAAGRALDEAVKSADNLPTVGRFSIEAAAGLAAPLVAVGRDAEARKLIDRHPATGPTGRLFAATSRALTRGTCDVDLEFREQPVSAFASQQWPVVLELAVAHGFPNEALRFARSEKSPAYRSENEIAWGEAVTFFKRHHLGADEAGLEGVSGALSGALKARFEARCGWLASTAKDQTAAKKDLAIATAALGKVVAGEEYVVPPLKELYSSTPADPTEARNKAMALAEIARLEGSLSMLEQAQSHLELAVKLLRASAPTPVAMQSRLDNLEKVGATAMRAELKAALQLKKEEQARAAVDQYRTVCRSFLAAASARFSLENEIVDSAITWDDPVHLWKLIASHAEQSDADRQEQWFATIVPWRLMVLLRHQGKAGVAEEIRHAAQGSSPPPFAVIDALAAGINEIDLNSVAKAMEREKGIDRSEREWGTFAVADRLIHAGKMKDAFRFVRLFDDQLVREEALQWTSALAVRTGKGTPLKALLQDANFVPTESVSAWRGFLLGLWTEERARAAASNAKNRP